MWQSVNMYLEMLYGPREILAGTLARAFTDWLATCERGESGVESSAWTMAPVSLSKTHTLETSITRRSCALSMGGLMSTAVIAVCLFYLEYLSVSVFRNSFFYTLDPGPHATREYRGMFMGCMGTPDAIETR